ncbi:hypothetical protein [Amycolatopsis kentuckyensis]|uniref:hypothetical protein n=1 Tax=Amycolatopsis kentuckyensis TaxID=218823 RepID=UPI003568F8F6
MNPEPWPKWLTSEQKARLVGLAIQFTWLVTQEPTEISRSVWGLWAPAEGPEINVALRADEPSFVGIYRCGEGFWAAGVPAFATAQESFTGTFDDVLTRAVEWRTERTAKR